jgi:hypothetical protein
MRHRSAPISGAILFFIMAATFSVVLWPNVAMAAKIAFFASGIGCGASIVRAVHRDAD